MKPKFRNLRSLAIASSVLLTVSYAQAATYTWTKAITDSTNLATNWSSGTNWPVVPVSAADTTLVFSYSWTSNSTARTNTLTSNVANPFLLDVSLCCPWRGYR